MSTTILYITARSGYRWIESVNDVATAVRSILAEHDDIYHIEAEDENGNMATVYHSH